MPSIYATVAIALVLFQHTARVVAHGAIVNAVGDAGGQGRALASKSFFRHSRLSITNTREL
jgi:hypothetical protein